MDWLILNADESELPEALRSEASKKRRGSGKRTAGDEEAAAAARARKTPRRARSRRS